MAPKKQTTAIIKSNQIVKDFILGPTYKDTRFEIRGERVEFYSVDTVTGAVVGGDYAFNRKGIVTSLLTITTNVGTFPDIATQVTFNGKKQDFRQFARASYYKALGDSSFMDAAAMAWTTGNGQPIANAIDVLPGINANDPFSTVVKIGSDSWFYA